ncbi:hypothetical protein AGATL06_13080 [Agathobaculum sp. TL06]
MLQLGDEYFGVQISVRSNAEFQLAWSDELQVIYQLSGRTYISMDESYFLMKQNDLFVINPYEVVDISLQGMLLCLSFSSYLTAPVNGIQFLCRSFCYGEESQDQFDTLRSELAEILKIYLFREEENKVDLLSHIYAFLNLLVKFFTAKKDIGREYDNNYSRLTLLLKYIQENYQQKISLGDLADITFFAPNYISHFFRDKMGTTFSNYLNDVRMKHAFYELCHTSKNITAIAMDNGFSSTNVFISRFREKYGVTPKKYRLGVQFQETDWKGGKDSHDSAISMDSFQALLQYGKIVQPHIPIPKEPVIRNIALNAADQPTQLYHDWRLIINAGYAFSCLSESVQKQLEIAKREIGFEYVRFHGLFNDNMQVYFEAENGTPCLRFQTVDLLFDKLLELSYKPYIEFGYVPQLLATNNSSIFETRSYISYPKDMEKWIYMVQTFLKHMMQRYGTKRIREWRFSLFGISFTQYGHLSRDEYYQLHKYTYQTVKDVDEQLKFCGPGFEGSLLLAKNEQVSKQFLERCMKEKCVPDYITAHSYPHSFQELIKNYKRIRSERDLQATLRLSDNEHFMQDVICSLKNTLAKLYCSTHR